MKTLADTVYDQREKIAFANKIREYGIENEEDLEEFKKFKLQKEAQKKALENVHHEDHRKNTINQDDTTDEEDGIFDQINIEKKH